MVREFCDRCGVEVTSEQTGAITGIDDADRDGNGNVTESFDILCSKCYGAVVAFIQTPPLQEPTS